MMMFSFNLILVSASSYCFLTFCFFEIFITKSMRNLLYYDKKMFLNHRMCDHIEMLTVG